MSITAHLKQFYTHFKGRLITHRGPCKYEKYAHMSYISINICAVKSWYRRRNGSFYVPCPPPPPQPSFLPPLICSCDSHRRICCVFCICKYVGSHSSCQHTCWYWFRTQRARLCRMAYFFFSRKTPCRPTDTRATSFCAAPVSWHQNVSLLLSVTGREGFFIVASVIVR